MPQIIGNQAITPLIIKTPQTEALKVKKDDSLSKTQWEIIIIISLFVILVIIIFLVMPKVKLLKL